MKAALLLGLGLLAGCGASSPAYDGPAGVPGVELPPYGPFDYQLGGPYDPAPATKVVTRDHTVDSARGRTASATSTPSRPSPRPATSGTTSTPTCS